MICPPPAPRAARLLLAAAMALGIHAAALAAKPAAPSAQATKASAPAKASAPSAQPASAASAPAAKIDLNSASVDELKRLPGLTASDAQTIVNRRSEARYQSTDDLVSRGILSTKKFQRISDRISVTR